MPPRRAPPNPLALAAVVLAVTACGGGPAAPGDDGADGGASASLAVETVVSGLQSPVGLAAPPGDDRLFLVEQAGRIRILRDGALLEGPFLDLTDRVSSGGERGLLGLAFHPEYATNGHLFVNYTDPAGDTRVERYTVDPGPNRADPASARLLLQVDQPFANHNGGLLAFGPDGMLYVALGDGGKGGDPEENGQDPSTLLGSLLRIDVDEGDPYSIPADNPFVGDPGGRDEIWAFGLRNPWRFAFDREAGILYIADVGQNEREEVNAADAEAGGLDYGWNTTEGTACFDPPVGCDPTGLTLPVLEYETGQDGTCAVTGGFVYRGDRIPELRGHYFYSDFCAGFLRSFRLEAGQAVDRREWQVGDLGRVTAFGEDAARELYLLSRDGRVFRLVPGG